MPVPTFHVYVDTPSGSRDPFTLLVFGPYTSNGGPEVVWDVEMWHGHVTVDTRRNSEYVMTFSDLPRDTHIVQDTIIDRHATVMEALSGAFAPGMLIV